MTVHPDPNVLASPLPPNGHKGRRVLVGLSAGLAGAVLFPGLLVLSVVVAKGASHFEWGVSYSLLMHVVFSCATYCLAALFLLVSLRAMRLPTFGAWRSLLAISVLSTLLWWSLPLGSLLRDVPIGWYFPLHALVAAAASLPFSLFPRQNRAP